MKFFVGILCVIALFLGGFGYWGLFTPAGRREYDEMDGFYPGFALLAAAILFLTAMILGLVIFFKARRQKAKS